MTAVLGIDPSLTTTGCALVEWHSGTDFPDPSWSTWRARASKPEVESVASTRRRIRVMLREILAFVPPRIDMSVVEGPSIGSKHAALADERAGLRWMLIDQLFARGPVVIVTPATRSILAADNGRASKKVVHAAVQAMLPGVHVPDHNVADAAAMAAAGAHALGLVMPYTGKQVSAHAKVAWPVGTAA